LFSDLNATLTLLSFPTRRSSDLIQDDQVGRFIFERLQRARAVSRLHDEIAGLAEGESDELAQIAIVIRDQDLHAVTSVGSVMVRSEEHTSELQSLAYLVCRLLLE